MKEVTPKQVEKLLNKEEKPSIIDVREDEEVAQGKIPIAKHIPLGMIEEKASELDKSKEYIIVCRSGRRSEMACNFLESQGFKVTNMVGGMMNWQGEVD